LNVVLALMMSVGVYARERVDFDFDWQFILDDNAAYSEVGVDDSQWQSVQLPHDWNITQDFDLEIGGHAAYLPEGIGWYRKTFSLPKSAQGQTVAIHFDGIFMQSDVYINGHLLGHRPYGFCSIEYDLTPYLKSGQNVIAVRVDTTGGRPRWYAGAGIYRHAWLNVADRVHVATYGTYVTTPEVKAERAAVHTATTVINKSAQRGEFAVTQRIIAPNGREVAKTSGKLALAVGDTADIQQDMAVANPQLWDIKSPQLYTLETTVKRGSKTLDRVTTPFGIRTIEFRADSGFYLNGEHVKLQGLCLHQDAGSMGVAVPDRVYERRLEILKEYGCNAIRMAHNQPSPELLDMCDRMGFVVIDEAFDKWKSGYYEKIFR